MTGKHIGQTKDEEIVMGPRDRSKGSVNSEEHK